MSPIITCLMNDIYASGDEDTMARLGALWDGAEDVLSQPPVTYQEAIHYFATQLLNPDRTDSLSLPSVLRHAHAALHPGHFESFFFHNPFFKNGRDVPFRTADHGYIGYASSGVQPGDLICVLGSYNMPIVLRPVTADQKYKFISLAHVMGVMYGEAWAGTAGESKTRRFYIV